MSSLFNFKMENLIFLIIRGVVSWTKINCVDTIRRKMTSIIRKLKKKNKLTSKKS